MNQLVSLKKNLAASYLGQSIAGLMSLAFVPIYVRLLGAEGYGLVGLFALLQAWLVILDLSISMTLGREIARYTAGLQPHSAIRNFMLGAELFTFTLALLVGGTIALCAGWIGTHWVRAEVLSAPTITHAVEAMGVILGLRLFEGLYRGCLLGMQKLVALNSLVSLIATLRWGGAAAVLMWFDASVVAFFVWQSVIAIAATLVYMLVAKRSLPSTAQSPRFPLQALWNVRSFFGAMLATYSLSFAVTNTDKVLLSKIVSLEAFGHYSLATLVASALLMIAAPIGQVLYPRLTVQSTREDWGKLAATYHLGAQLLTIVLTPPALILIVFGPELLAAWTGDPSLARQVGPLLQILSFGTLLNGYMGMPHMLQLANGWPGLSARTNLVAAIILVPVILAIAPRYGAQGTAWVWVVLNASYIAIIVPIMHRRLLPNQMWKWYWHDVTVPGCTALAPIAFSYWLYPETAGQMMTWFWLIATGALSVACAAMGSCQARGRIFSLMRPGA